MMSQEFDFGELDDLYREVILDHYRRPKNRRQIEDPDFESKGFNPFCGDEVLLQVKMDSEGRVCDASQQGQGCSISQASASIMTDLLKGKTVEETRELANSFREMMRGAEIPDSELEAMGELEALQGVRKFPVRIKCALLAWAALEDGLKEYRAKTEAG